MTTASPAASGGRGRIHNLAMALGHYSRYAVTPVVVIWALIVIDWWTANDGPLEPWLTIIGLPLILFFLVATACEMLVHERHLCEREFAEAPLDDPQGAVDAHLHSLRIYHHPRSRWLPVAVVIPPIGALLLMSGNEDASLLLRVVLTALAVAGIIAATFFARVRVWHLRLRPWCPYCRRPGDEDDHEVEPTPDPAGTSER